MRINKNPRIEKKKDWRNSANRWYYRRNPVTTRWLCKKANHAYRQKWHQLRWFYAQDDTLEFSSYNPRHQVLWDIS
jgi:hypothetical protein